MLHVLPGTVPGATVLLVIRDSLALVSSNSYAGAAEHPHPRRQERRSPSLRPQVAGASEVPPQWSPKPVMQVLQMGEHLLLSLASNARDRKRHLPEDSQAFRPKRQKTCHCHRKVDSGRRTTRSLGSRLPQTADGRARAMGHSAGPECPVHQEQWRRGIWHLCLNRMRRIDLFRQSSMHFTFKEL